jgi:hypothetical protein
MPPRHRGRGRRRAGSGDARSAPILRPRAGGRRAKRGEVTKRCSTRGAPDVLRLAARVGALAARVAPQARSRGAPRPGRRPGSRSGEAVLLSDADAAALVRRAAAESFVLLANDGHPAAGAGRAPQGRRRRAERGPAVHAGRRRRPHRRPMPSRRSTDCGPRLPNVEIVHEAGGGIDLFLPPLTAMDVRDLDGNGAVAAAASADVAIVVVGNDEFWESEGRDRKTVTLPGPPGRARRARRRGQPQDRRRGQRRLPDGSALGRRRWPRSSTPGCRARNSATPWRTSCSGRRAGRPPAGDACPPRRRLPRLRHDPGAGRRAGLREGVNVGYRGFDAAGVEPRFASGTASATPRSSTSRWIWRGRPGRGRAARAAVKLRNTGPRPARKSSRSTSPISRARCRARRAS